MSKKCCCCEDEHCHNNEHEHEHNHEHEHGESTKGKIISLIISAVLLVAAIVVSHIFEFKTYIKVIMFAVPYWVAGFDVLKEAAENILHGEIFDENFLMCIASIGAFAVGEYPEAVFVMIFFGVGELFEHIATERSRKTIKSLLDIRPDTALIIKDGKETEILSKDVRPGDILKVLPGKRVPLDGIITEGKTTTDNSSITGESIPVTASTGDTVFGGTINLTGEILIRVIKDYEESTASKILKLVEQSAEKKSKSERFIKRFAKYYTPAVCIAAVLVAVVPSLIFGGIKTYIYRSLMFLVVSCPCALVLSIPLTYFAGIASAAKKGVLIKGGGYLEALSRTKCAVFDKTGTLTRGEFKVIAIHPDKVNERELLRLAAAGSGKTHPISLSLRAAYGKMEPMEIHEYTEIAGEGTRSVIDGKEVVVGNHKLMKRYNIDYHDCHSAGTIVHVAAGGEYLGHVVIGDTLKLDAAKAVNALKKRGIKVVMLTGDRESAAKSIAEKLKVDEYHSELKPGDKVKYLEEYLGKNGAVIFIGDGINDAPVLVRADVGISMSALGSDAAIEAADAVLMDDKVYSVETAINTSKRTQKIVIENIIFSLFIKFGVLLLCGFGAGFMNMWIAAFADVGVMVIAVLNSLRALK